jgi:MYXO-CTERM domain-containing protein
LITVEPMDSVGGLVGTDLDVLIRTTAGALTEVIGHESGTYTAELTSTNCPDDPAEVTAAVEGVLLDVSALVWLTCDEIRDAIFEVEPDRIPGNGEQCSTVTVTPLLSGDEPIGPSQAVTMETSFGDLGPVIDLGDGTYQASFCSDTCNDTQPAVITATVNGVSLVSLSPSLVGRVTVFCIAVDAAASLLSAAPSEILADNQAAATVTVTPIDNTGEIMGSGLNVVIHSSLGRLTEVEDLGDGTYVALLTAQVPGVANIGATVNGVDIAATAQVGLLDPALRPGIESLELEYELHSGMPAAGARVEMLIRVTSNLDTDLENATLLLYVLENGAQIVDGIQIDGEDAESSALTATRTDGVVVMLPTIGTAAIEVTYSVEIERNADAAIKLLAQAMHTDGEPLSAVASALLTLGQINLPTAASQEACGCATTNRPGDPLAWLLVFGGLLLVRRRTRR